MKTKKLSLYTKIISGLSGLMMLSVACQVVQPEAIDSTEPVTNEEISNSEVIDAPVSPEGMQLNIEPGNLAQDVSEKIISAVSPDNSHPYWEILPEHHVYSLQGYPVSNHMLKAQIFVYPVKELALFNEGADRIAKDLALLLENQQVGENIPFLPLINAAQVMHTQVEFINFANGKGVRFLTQFDQAPYVINNYEMFYTFQGLSNDGKYYVAVILPVSHPELPDDLQLFSTDESELKDFPEYLDKTIDWMNEQSSNSFSPDLTELDGLIQSLEIK